MEKSHKLMWVGVLIFLFGVSMFFYYVVSFQVGPGTAAHCWSLETVLGLASGYMNQENGPIGIPECFEWENFRGEDIDLRDSNIKEMWPDNSMEILFECDVKSPDVSCSPYRLQIGDTYEDFEFSYRTEEDKIYIKVSEIEKRGGFEIESLHIVLFLMFLGASLIAYGLHTGRKARKK